MMAICPPLGVTSLFLTLFYDEIHSIITDGTSHMLTHMGLSDEYAPLNASGVIFIGDLAIGRGYGSVSSAFAKGTKNPKVSNAILKGKKAHTSFAQTVTSKPGWQSEPLITGPNGQKLRPDAISPKGKPVELKPKTPSGIKKGKAQIKKYEQALGTKGKVIYYDPSTFE